MGQLKYRQTPSSAFQTLATTYIPAGAVRYDQAQSLTDAQKSQARSNIGTKATLLTGILTSAGWSNNTQTITISGLETSGYVYTVTPASSSFTNYADAQIYANDITVEDNITFNCSSVPTNDISVVILKVEVA